MSNQPNQHRHASQGERDKNDQKSGNFKNDPERAREAGRKGGEHSHGNKERE